MNVYLTCAVLVAMVAAEAPSGPYPAASGPYPPSGWKPSGRLLVLPARQQVSPVYGPPPAEYGPPTDKYGPPPTEAPTEPATDPTTTQEAPAEEVTEAAGGETAQLRDGGVYYVLLQNGKLQMVRYQTAPLRSQAKAQRQQKAPRNSFAETFQKSENQRIKSQKQKQAQFSQVQAHQAQFQPQPAKIQQQPAKFNQQTAQINQQPQPFHYVEIQKSHEIEVAQPQPETASNGFVANLQYREVEPISAPIFAFNQAPLTRILKK